MQQYSFYQTYLSETSFNTLPSSFILKYKKGQFYLPISHYKYRFIFHAIWCRCVLPLAHDWNHIFYARFSPMYKTQHLKIWFTSLQFANTC